MKILGIDPSQRHTGLALLDENDPVGRPPLFCEIQTRGTDLLSSVRRITTEFRIFVCENTCVNETAFSMEKTVASGQSSQLLFYVQMALFEEISARFKGSEPIMINPLPVQLKSYIWHRHGIKMHGMPKSAVVNGWKAMMGEAWGNKRISSHLVEAYFLARLGVDVLHHEWEYAPPSRERPLVPWPINYGVKYA